MTEHQVIVNLSSEALREALDRAQARRLSLSELVEALLRDGGTGVAPQDPPARAAVAGSVASVPAVATPTETRGVLSFLTNRLSPIKVAVATLADLSADGEWPPLGDFQTHAANAARTLGLRLRKEDDRAGRRGAARRWTGYPVGHDADSARGRYIASFTAVLRDDELRGPLAVLGLASRTGEGGIALTEVGQELARVMTPPDESVDFTLSSAEVEIFTLRLHAARDEAAAVADFLGAVRHVAGRQGELDALLATRNSDWSANQASAQRAAMLGRLGELGVVRVKEGDLMFATQMTSFFKIPSAG